MDYIYNIKTSVVTGFFKRRKIGQVTFEGIHFSNPLQIGEWPHVNHPLYRDRVSRPGPIWVGEIKNVDHIGNPRDSTNSSSTVYAECKIRNNLSARFHLYELRSLKGFFQGNTEQLPLSF